MPLVKVYMQKGKTKEHKKAVLDGIHKALVSSFKIPKTDRKLLLNEYEKEHFDCVNENFVIIYITAFSGRSKDAKKKLYNEIIENICKNTNLQPTDIFIIVNDVPKENWGIRGGQMASDTDLGFKIDV